jgi:hypothetical protein
MILGSLLLCTAQESDEYQKAMARAAALEKQEKYAEAARVLEPLVPEYPQTYDLFLKLGWLHFSAKSHSRALERYRTAYKLSGGGTEPLLGIAWCRFRLGERDKAHELFARILKSDPGNKSAREGFELSRPDRRTPVRAEPTPWATALSGFVTFHDYSDHPRKDWAIAGVGKVDFTIDTNYRLGGAFRYTHFEIEETALYSTTLRQRRRRGSDTNVAGSSSTTYTFGQEEVYLWGGVTYPEFDVLGHIAFADDDGELDSAYALGGSGRLAIPHGALFGEMSFTDYDDENVFRTAVAWDAPLNEQFSVRPGAALQSGDGDAFFTGFATLSFHGEWGEVYVGGKLGEEFRPLYLGEPSIYNLPENIDGGFWVGARFALDESWTLDAVVERYELEYDEDGIDYDATLTLWSAGLTVRF